MIVDDSAVVRGMLARILEEDAAISVVASVADGEMALSAIKHYPVDVVILDVEMPRMDGLTALPKLLEVAPNVKIIMASSHTMKGADVSMRALALGAADCVAKPSAQRDKDAVDTYYRELIAKIKALTGAIADTSVKVNSTGASNAILPVFSNNNSKNHDVISVKYPTHKPSALAIASSTGGPQALLTLFKGLKGALNHIPVFITQHMPANFTTILAGNIATAADKDCHEAVDGEVVRAGCIYLAPGNYHMIPKRKGTDIVLSLSQEPPVNFCRPAADPMMDGLIAVYGRDVLLAVLTGMGQDGCQGAKSLVTKGGTVIAQDEASSVVWGMPKAIVENNLHSAALPLDGIAPYIMRAFGEKA